MSADTAVTDQGLRTLLQDALGLTTPLSMNIHPNDQMLNFITSIRGSGLVGRSEYYVSGVQLMKILEQLVEWRFGSFDNVGSLLDFASGYGRVTRFLVHNLPADRIWVSDIQVDAVAFQQAEFGVHGFVSTAGPVDLAPGRTFDCIYVASLFSHLPEATFTSWLKKLFSLLNPCGLLAFSVNDESRLPAGQTLPETGIWFVEASEVASLDTKAYGTSMVSEAFVRKAIAEATGRPEYRRIEYGMQYHQDLYVLLNEPSPDFSGLHFAYLPHGAVDSAIWKGADELFLRGWAINLSEDNSPVEVQILVDGQLRQKCTPSIPRQDVRDSFKDDRFLLSEWQCSLHLPGHDSSQPILVKGVSSTGTESLLYAGTIASLEPRGGVDSCFWAEPGELSVEGWAVDLSEDASPVEVQILVDGQLRQKCLPFMSRPDLQAHFHDSRFLYAGWRCSLHLPEHDSSQTLVVQTVSGGGHTSLLYIGAIDFIEKPDYSKMNLERERELLRNLVADREEQLEYIQRLEAELARKSSALAALEAELARKNAALTDLEARMRRRSWQWHLSSHRR